MAFSVGFVIIMLLSSADFDGTFHLSIAFFIKF